MVTEEVFRLYVVGDEKFCGATAVQLG